MNNNLFDYINRYIEISKSEVELFETYPRKKTVKKKEYLLKVGEVCKSRYYISKGCFRFFYIDKKGNEQIIHLRIDNWWITDYDSLVNKEPSRLYIQSLEDSELLELNQKSFEEAKKYYSENEIAQLIMLVGTINTWNRIAISTHMYHK